MIDSTAAASKVRTETPAISTGVAHAKHTFETEKVSTEEVANLFQHTFAAATKGAADYNDARRGAAILPAENAENAKKSARDQLQGGERVLDDFSHLAEREGYFRFFNVVLGPVDESFG
jgi:hypothetical protein